MRYGVKVPKKSEAYYADKDIEMVRKKYKGKLPPFGVLSKEAQETLFKEHKDLRTKGTTVMFKHKPAVVQGSNDKGVFLKYIPKDYLDSKETKTFFVPNQEYHDNTTLHFFNRSKIML